MIKRKRLFFDIETSPNIGFFWQSGYKLDIGYDNIIKERSIICIAYKWENSKTQCLTWDKHQSDRKIVEKFSKIIEEADEVVAHNGDNFDIKWLRTRCIKYGVSLNPNIITLDTLKIARSKFKFNSNRLDYIAQYLGVGKKIDNGGINLWKDIVLHKNNKSLKKLIVYCKNDVLILERIWDKLNKYVSHKTDIGGRGNCPECGGDNLVIRGRSISASAKLKYRLQCKNCGKYKTINL